MSVRSTEDDTGVAITTDIDVNVTTFDVFVTSLNARGFAFTMLDYHTGAPLRGAVYMGNRAIAKFAIVLPAAAIEKADRRLRSSAATPHDIAVGDEAKLYGFQRPGSKMIDVFRVEDRGRRYHQRADTLSTLLSAS